MSFATYLLRCGLITKAQFADAVQRQLERRIPIGKIAIETDKLSTPDVADVLRTQAEQNRPFGRVAVETGLLSEHDVAFLMMVQNNRDEPIGEILVEMGVMDRRSMEAELANARRQWANEFQANHEAATAVSLID